MNYLNFKLLSELTIGFKVVSIASSFPNLNKNSKFNEINTLNKSKKFDLSFFYSIK